MISFGCRPSENSSLVSASLTLLGKADSRLKGLLRKSEGTEFQSRVFLNKGREAAG